MIEHEWLETDGLGGYAMGSEDLIPRRRYHSLLTVASKPPVGRTILVNAVELLIKVVRTTGDTLIYPLTSIRYKDLTVHPRGIDYLTSFNNELYPTWLFHLPEGLSLTLKIVKQPRFPFTLLGWSLLEETLPDNVVAVYNHLRPLLSGRDHHALHRENSALSFQVQRTPRSIIWRTYPHIPEIAAITELEYAHEPLWFRNVHYDFDNTRGYEAQEDLASPGYFWGKLDPKKINSILFAAPELLPASNCLDVPIGILTTNIFHEEALRRKEFPSKLHYAASNYIVKRGDNKSIIAGYPWFSDWGRDTFIAIRGLCLTRSSTLFLGKEIILTWRRAISHGMIPNLFPEDIHGRPLFNAVDASLWYIVSVYEYLRASNDYDPDLVQSIEEIITGYINGTRFGIKLDSNDGLITGGIHGVQLSWMDAKVGALVVTPRIGKPVEVEALWINALKIAEEFTSEWVSIRTLAEDSFKRLFWNSNTHELFDCVDADNIKGNIDSSSRPNQIFAVGGVPFMSLPLHEARLVVDSVERTLFTPHGLRTLSPGDKRYRPFYLGTLHERDLSYHQGTVWPWLLGAFVEGWCRVRGNTQVAKEEAKRRFLDPFLASPIISPGGHVYEIADGAFPHAPRGCPFQAWSLAEIIRLKDSVLAD
jgi:predicted glycogen debranching enzyme